METSAQSFAATWKASQLKETAGYVSHFEDLCRLVGHRTPVVEDPGGTHFTYQRAAAKMSGKPGFADVWYRDHFGWEYKGKGKSLDDAHNQLLQYRDNLANPPLLIVSDFDTIQVTTNFTGTVPRKFVITLDDIGSGEVLHGQTATALEILRACFFAPDSLRPGETTEALTTDVASLFGRVADSLRTSWKHDDHDVALFLTKLLFCMFASDVGLLPKGIVGRLIDANLARAPDFAEQLQALFETMRTGGYFGVDRIAHFNGGLFTDTDALLIDSDNLRQLRSADDLDWSAIEPSIFGTLFERILDPAKRHQLGSHYTSRPDIELVVGPVVMWPLEREWEKVKTEAEPWLGWRVEADATIRKNQRQLLLSTLEEFLARLSSVKILDPACGSGNFLYVTLAMLKELERRVIAFGLEAGIDGLQARVHPRQLWGIESSEYAHQLSSIVVWIGYLQWKYTNGIPMTTEIPILEPLDNVRLMDAIVENRAGGPVEPGWPEVDFIVGNPPFLGGKLLRRYLGDRYVDAMFNVWEGRVRRESDLCCYWHEKARAMVGEGKAKRVGLLATQAIRKGANRDTLKRIKETGDIFFAQSDREWILDGAAVHISMVAFDDGSETRRTLDGGPVGAINADLSHSTDLTSARRLKENVGIAFMGDTKVGPFELADKEARTMLAAPNPDGRSNADVIRPWVNGDDITGRRRSLWIIDFPPGTTQREAALYEAPFEYIRKYVRPMRAQARSGDATGVPWWIHQRPRPAMRAALAGLNRYLATPNLTKYRFFAWLTPEVLPDHQLIVFARQDDYTFGVLHSRVHELWARRQGSQLREVESGFRYTPTTCFETFPFPRPGEDRKRRIGDAAARLNELRESWLNPLHGSLTEAELKKRTLTDLYNERPAWLDNAHRDLDEAVFAAYGWPPTLSDEEILDRLLAHNLERSDVVEP
ncbi:MAG: class I SAM-dependent DNA methyltransferase [Dehalococcoidia bacterium]|nr:class I SAM-dependent DNA methyltransferase [Dehalococcoidia bacterium]